MRPTVLAATLSTCLFAPVAPTAHAAPSDSTIVVTASRFADSVDDLVAGVRIIDREAIRDAGATSIADALVRLGGVHVRNTTGDGTVQIDLRGFGVAGDQNTLILLDGVRLSEYENTPARLDAIPLESIERIEILPGAGAVLYGGGATAGTINLITRLGAQTGVHGRVTADAGEYDNRRLSTQVDLASDVLAARLTAVEHRGDNYRDNSDIDEQAVRGELRARLASGDAWLKGGHSRSNYGMPGPLTLTEYRDDPRQSVNPDDRGRTETDDAVIGLRQLFGRAEAVIEGGWRERDLESTTPSFADARNHTGSSQRTLAPRLRLPLDLGGIGGHLVVGGDWADWRYRQRLAMPGFFYDSDVHADQNDRALYAQAQLSLRSATRLSLGARRQSTRIERNEINTFSMRDQARDDTLTAWDLGMRHQLDSTWTLFGRWAQSFRAGNVDDNGFTATGELLKPQTAHDAQIGLEADTDNTHLSAMIFESRIKNEIHFLAIPAVFFFNGASTNLPPTRHRGIEIDARHQLDARWQIGGSYRYTDARFREGNFGAYDLRDNAVPLVPRHRYTVRLTGRLGNADTVHANWRYVGAQRYDNDQVNAVSRMPSYDVLDVKWTHRWSDWALSVQVDNLLDARYFSYGIIPDPSLPVPNVYPETGRMARVSAEWRF